MPNKIKKISKKKNKTGYNNIGKGLQNINKVKVNVKVHPSSSGGGYSNGGSSSSSSTSQPYPVYQNQNQNHSFNAPPSNHGFHQNTQTEPYLNLYPIRDNRPTHDNNNPPPPPYPPHEGNRVGIPINQGSDGLNLFLIPPPRETLLGPPVYNHPPPPPDNPEQPRIRIPETIEPTNPIINLVDETVPLRHAPIFEDELKIGLGLVESVLKFQEDKIKQKQTEDKMRLYLEEDKKNRIDKEKNELDKYKENLKMFRELRTLEKLKSLEEDKEIIVKKEQLIVKESDEIANKPKKIGRPKNTFIPPLELEKAYTKGYQKEYYKSQGEKDNRDEAVKELLKRNKEKEEEDIKRKALEKMKEEEKKRIKHDEDKIRHLELKNAADRERKKRVERINESMRTPEIRIIPPSSSSSTLLERVKKDMELRKKRMAVLLKPRNEVMKKANAINLKTKK